MNTTTSGARSRPLYARLRRGPPRQPGAIVSVPVDAPPNVTTHSQLPSSQWSPLRATAWVNLQQHEAAIARQTTQASEAKKLFNAHPQREHGVPATKAKKRAMLLALIDLPAMVATAEAVRVENPFALVLLALAATALNGIFGWETGRAIRNHEQSPEVPTAFGTWSVRLLLILCATWIVALFLIRVNASMAWSPFAMNPFVVALFLTLFAGGVMAVCGRLAWEAETDRVAEARAAVERHERERAIAQRARDIYVQDLHAAAGLDAKEGVQ